MNNIKLLDCTLRDGGYLIDWEFGHNNMISIFERLVDANVDMIEIGFLDDRRSFDINRSIMPDTASVEKIFGGLDRKQAMVVGMIDYGTCSLEHIQPCEESFLDAIRVIFKKHLREEALHFCAELKKLGYKVFAQLVSVTSYEDDEMLDLIRLANEVKPYAVSMVDTYGLMHQDNLKHYFDLLNENLSMEIALGYHAHNNFQMGYANCITMMSQNVSRMLLVDGTLYGMGKSAGNAPIELIAMYMNHHFGEKYQISQLLEAIDSCILNFHSSSTWGYNMFYYLAASNDCHPNYVSYLTEKRTLSVKSINEILGKLQGEKKLLYDKKYIELLYRNYQTVDVNDTEDIGKLKKELSERKILLLAPGRNIKKQVEKINNYLKEHNPIIIAINFWPEDFGADYIFLSNSKRYVQLASTLAKHPKCSIIATSNLTKTSGKFDYTLNFSPLIDSEAEIIDNPFFMLLKIMKRLEIKSVALAGFDGYSGNAGQDYIDSHMEYKFSIAQAASINEYTMEKLAKIKKDISIKFVTDSRYSGGYYEN